MGDSKTSECNTELKGVQYTDEQKKVIGHDEGFLRVVACAGSGKTETISRRVAELIKKGVKPKEIVAFTFTEKAADELKSRIRSTLDRECPSKADFGDMYIGTIHSFCFHMLQELIPKYKNFDVLDPAKQVAYISKKDIFRELDLWSLKYYGKSKIVEDKPNLKDYSVIDRFIRTINIIMMEGMDPDDIVDVRSKGHLKYSYEKYMESIEKHHYLDFSSMIYIFVKLLENNPEVLDELNQRVKHLIVDEYQDVNKIQEKLIEFIARGATSVCVVGDDDQCIFYWNGSFIENILSFNERYSENVMDVPLDVNFRSTEGIIRIASDFIKNNKKRLAIKDMACSNKLKRHYNKGDIIYKCLESVDEENEFILNKIRSLLWTDFTDKKNRPFALSEGDFAILVRRNADIAPIVDYLSENGIECVAYGGGSIFQRPEVLFAMDCIAYLFRCKTYKYKETPSLPDLRKKYVENFKGYIEADVDFFIGSIETLKKEVDKIFDKEKDYLGDLGLQAIYHKILSCFGAQRFKFSPSFNYNFAVLSKAISDYESVWIRLKATEVEGFFRFAQSYGEAKNVYLDPQYADASKLDAVKVLTIHKAKGLEFPVVFIPGAIKPKRKNHLITFLDKGCYEFDRYDGNLEDERRVFYTALTRSEKYLFITSTKKRHNKTTTYEPHPFIKELNHEFISEDLELKRPKSGYSSRPHYNLFFPTSFSELTTFDRCPYDYLLRHVYGYNAGVPAAFGYGTNIHNILNKIHKDFIKNKKIPSEDDINIIFNEMFHLRYATDKISANMEKGAKKVVKNYVNVQKDEFNKILETEKRFEFVLEEALISGQIDLLKKIDDTGNVTEVEIIDFKTEGTQANTFYQLDYEKQLRLYAIACLKSLGLNPKKACIHHLNKNNRSYVDISKSKLNETKEDVQSSIHKILTKEFKSKRSKTCDKCDYRYLCSLKGKEIRI